MGSFVGLGMERTLMSLDQIPFAPVILNIRHVGPRHSLASVPSVAESTWKGAFICVNTLMTGAMFAAFKYSPAMTTAVDAFGTSTPRPHWGLGIERRRGNDLKRVSRHVPIGLEN